MGMIWMSVRNLFLLSVTLPAAWSASSCTGTDLPDIYKKQVKISKTTYFSVTTLYNDTDYGYIIDTGDDIDYNYDMTYQLEFDASNDLCSALSVTDTTNIAYGGSNLTLGYIEIECSVESGKIKIISNVTFSNSFLSTFVVSEDAQALEQALEDIDPLTTTEYSEWLKELLQSDSNLANDFVASVDAAVIQDYGFRDRYFMQSDSNYDTKTAELDVICDIGTNSYATLDEAHDDGYVCPDMSLYKCVYLCLVTTDCTAIQFNNGTQEGGLKSPQGLCVLTTLVETQINTYNSITHADDTACTVANSDGITACDISAHLADSSTTKQNKYPLDGSKHEGDPDEGNGVQTIFIGYVTGTAGADTALEKFVFSAAAADLVPEAGLLVETDDNIVIETNCYLEGTSYDETAKACLTDGLYLGRYYQSIYIEMEGNWCENYCEIGLMQHMVDEMETGLGDCGGSCKCFDNGECNLYVNYTSCVNSTSDGTFSFIVNMAYSLCLDGCSGSQIDAAIPQIDTAIEYIANVNYDDLMKSVLSATEEADAEWMTKMNETSTVNVAVKVSEEDSTDGTTCSKPTIANGGVRPTNDTIEAGDSYSASCSNGYILDGDATIECQVDGTLSTAPTCIVNGAVNTCDKPEIANGVVNPGDATIDVNSTYSVVCNDGYTASSNAPMICKADGTLDIVHTCEVNTCDQPKIANGVVHPETATIEFGSIYIVTCNDGYTASSYAAMICTADGTLDIVHTCDSEVNTSCGKPEIANGVVTPEDATIDFNSTYSVVCNDGYTASSNAPMICKADGTLDIVHTCDSEVNTCDQPEIANGVVHPETATIVFGSIYIVICNDGYTASSDAAMLCTADGTLDIVHTCDSEAIYVKYIPVIMWILAGLLVISVVMLLILVRCIISLRRSKLKSTNTVQPIHVQNSLYEDGNHVLQDNLYKDGELTVQNSLYKDGDHVQNDHVQADLEQDNMYEYGDRDQNSDSFYEYGDYEEEDNIYEYGNDF